MAGLKTLSLLRRALPLTATLNSTCTSGLATCNLQFTTSAAAHLAEPAVQTDVLHDVVSTQLEEIRKAGTYKLERVIMTPQGTNVGVHLPQGSPAGSVQQVIVLCANNYLGLSNHPEVARAAIGAIQSHGFGLSSVRFICGTQDLHKKLESRISTFHGTQDTILYPSCFDANAGLFEALLGPEDAVISDELNHASIIDGIRLCKAMRYRFKHMDMHDLEAQLIAATERGARIKLIATDGVFSMDGDVAPLRDIVHLARKYNAYTFVDECHATGLVGATGRGSDEACGVQGQVDIINSTLGKALGGATGGYTTGRKEVIDLLRQKARPYLFSNTLAPAVAGASLKVFDLLEADNKLVARLHENTHFFRTAMTAKGFSIRPGDHPIVPIMLGEAQLAGEMATRLLARGIYVVGFSFPVVPRGKARIRVQVSAAHTRQQLEEAVEAFAAVGQELGVISR